MCKTFNYRQKSSFLHHFSASADVIIAYITTRGRSTSLLNDLVYIAFTQKNLESKTECENC